MFTRRHFLAGTASASLAAAAVGTMATPAHAKDSGIVRYGPASTSVVERGAALVGNSMFMTSRFLVDGKVRIVEVDIRTGEVVWTDDVLLSPDQLAAGGGNTMTSDGRYAYICPHGLGTLFRLDPETHEVIEFASEVADDHAQWYECTVAEGYLFAGAYPDAEVVRVDLDTREVFNYGRISSSPYVGTIAVTATKVWATGKGASRLMEWPLAGGTPRDITSYIGHGYTSAIDMVHSDGLLYISVGKYVISFDPVDGSNHVDRLLPDPLDRYIDFMCVGSDGTVYATARTSGNIYRVEPDGLTLLGAPLAGDLTNLTMAELEPGVLCGASSNGRVYTMRIGEEPQVFEIESQGVGLPDRIMTIFAHNNGSVWASGSGSFTVHDIGNGTRRRQSNRGEIKCMVEGRDGWVYAMKYPQCVILRIDPATLEIAEIGQLTDQYRPNTVLYDAERNQLIISSGPSLGQNQGAVSFHDLGTGETETRTDYLPDQIAYGMVIRSGLLHVCGDVYGEATGNVRDLGQVASIDLETRELRHRSSPVPGGRSYRDVAFSRGQLYLQMYRPHGEVHRFDPVRGTATLVGDVGSYGDMANFGGSLVHVTRHNSSIWLQNGEDFVLVHDHVPAEWYSAPNAPVSVRRRGVYGLWGSDLAFYPLG